MDALILSRFDPSYGPKIFLKAPESLDEDSIEKVPQFMDMRPDEFFIHIFEGLRTANLYFKIPSKHARGGKEAFLISIIMDINSDIKFTLAKEFLENFVSGFLDIEDAYLAFDYDVRNHEGDEEKLSEIESFFFSFYNSIKPAIKALEEAENRYQALFKGARDAILIQNKEFDIIVDVNKKAEELFEQPREDIIGLVPSQLKIVDPKEYNEFKIEIKKYLKKKTSIPLYMNLKKSNGKRVFLEVSASEINLENQQLIQFIFHDITLRRETQKILVQHIKDIKLLNQIITTGNQAEDLNKFLNDIMDPFLDYINYEGCYLYLINEDDNVAEIKALKGIPEFYLNENKSIKIDEKPHDLIFIKGVALFNDNFPENKKEILKESDFISIIIIPLFSKFNIIGSINLISKEEKTLTIKQQELLISIGLELGTIINRIKNEEILRKKGIIT